MARKPVSERRPEIASRIQDLKNQMRNLEEKEVERLGKAAKTAGLLELGLADNDLKKEFTDIVIRFQGQTKQG